MIELFSSEDDEKLSFSDVLTSDAILEDFMPKLTISEIRFQFSFIFLSFYRIDYKMSLNLKKNVEFFRD